MAIRWRERRIRLLRRSMWGLFFSRQRCIFPSRFKPFDSHVQGSFTTQRFAEGLTWLVFTGQVQIVHSMSVLTDLYRSDLYMQHCISCATATPPAQVQLRHQPHSVECETSLCRSAACRGSRSMCKLTTPAIVASALPQNLAWLIYSFLGSVLPSTFILSSHVPDYLKFG